MIEQNIEEWRDIKDYPNYMVSNLGRIKSLERYVICGNGCGGVHPIKEKILKQHLSHKGYLMVHLSKNGITKDYLIHRLVCQAFIPNPYNLPQVNHKNEIKTDNRVENLEWCTNKYNCNYGTRTKRQKEKISKTVLQFTKDGEFVKRWNCGLDIQRELGFSQSHISDCCNGKRKSSNGYKWSYGEKVA